MKNYKHKISVSEYTVPVVTIVDGENKKFDHTFESVSGLSWNEVESIVYDHLLFSTDVGTEIFISHNFNETPKPTKIFSISAEKLMKYGTHVVKEEESNAVC